MLFDTEKYLTIQEFANKVDESHQMIRHYLVDNRIKHIKFGGRFYIEKAEVKNWPPALKRLGRPREK